MTDCNVLIIGSGLAGLSAAVRLRELGVEDVVVIEMMSGAQYEHYHRTCGEAISDRMVRLSGIGRDCAIREIDSAVITCGDVDIRVRSKGAIIDRVALLRAMSSIGGANIVRGSVRAVKETDGGYIVETEGQQYRCKFLVGADGAFSVVRKNLFGYGPEVKMAAVNNLVEGDSEISEIRFTVSPRYSGSYRWDFPSKDGLRSIGYIQGTDDLQDYSERGIRFIVTGTNRHVVNGNCCIVGDAALLANPLCYGGIGVALLSGRKAAEGIARGDLSGYQKWVRKSIMFDPHYMKAYNTFKEWNQSEFDDAVVPFRKSSSLLLMRGAYAILRRPKWANVYTSIWMGFKYCW